jgi:hypothetical protein
MRRLIHPILLLSATLSLHGQGSVNFANVGVGLNSPFINLSAGGARLNGGTWTIELWAGPVDGGAGAVMPGPAYMGGFANGYFNAGQRTVVNGIGSVAFAQVRVWDNMGGTISSWTQATATDGVLWGSSGWFQISLSTPPATPATMVNMPVVWVGIPEPSALMLGYLGAVGALLVRRR